MGWLDYINASPDLASAFAGSGSTDPNAWGQQHFQQYGINENRPGVPATTTPTTFNAPAASQTPSAPAYDPTPTGFNQWLVTNPNTGRRGNYQQWTDPVTGNAWYVPGEYNLEDIRREDAMRAGLPITTTSTGGGGTTTTASQPPAATVPPLPNVPGVSTPGVSSPSNQGRTVSVNDPSGGYTIENGVITQSSNPNYPVGSNMPTFGGESGPLQVDPNTQLIQQLSDAVSGMQGQMGGLFNLPTLTKDTYPSSSSGIDWNSGYGSDLLKSLTNSINQLPQMAQQFGDTLQGQYSNLMKRSLSPDMFQGTLNNLASRGMLGSSEAGNAMGRTAKDIMNTVGDRAYESQLQGLQQQMQLPGLLGQLAQLLQTSKSSDPLAPYQLAMNYY